MYRCCGTRVVHASCVRLLVYKLPCSRHDRRHLGAKWALWRAADVGAFDRRRGTVCSNSTERIGNLAMYDASAGHYMVYYAAFFETVLDNTGEHAQLVCTPLAICRDAEASLLL